MPRKQSFRLRFTFWLDMLIPDEQVLGDYVEELKTQRSFAKTIRDGLRLMRDLRAGKVDVLFELFPWVKAEFVAGVMPKPDSDPSDKVQRQLDELKDLFLRSTMPPMVAAPAGPAPRALTSIAPAATGAPRALNVPRFDLPTFDDDDPDTLILAKDTSSDSAVNFLNSVLALQ